MKEEIEKSIIRARTNKALRRNGVQNEIVKIEPTMMAELLFEIWKIVGRTKTYPEEWNCGLITTIQKEGVTREPKNYRPLWILSCIRKISEAAVAESISERLNIYGRQYGFQRGLSATSTLLEVDVVVKGGKNRIATLHLAKAYDKINRMTLLQDCKQVINEEIKNILPACLQVLKVTTKGDVTGKEASIKLGLTQGTPLSPTLFLVHINDILRFCRRHTEHEVVEKRIGSAEITLTSDDVAIHTKTGQTCRYGWTPALKGLTNKAMKWENAK